MRYSASNPLHRKINFSGLCHGDDSVMDQVVVCGCMLSFSGGDVGIIAVGISRASTIATVFFFLYSWHLGFCREFYGTPYQGKLMDPYGSTTRRSQFFLFVLSPIVCSVCFCLDVCTLCHASHIKKGRLPKRFTLGGVTFVVQSLIFFHIRHKKPVTFVARHPFC